MLKKQDKNSSVGSKIGANTTSTVPDNKWKKISIILGALLSLTLFFLVYQGQMDEGVGDNYIRHDIAGFVKNVRSLPSDPIVIRSHLEDAYAFTTRKGKKQLDKMLKEINLKDKISCLISVSVQIKSIKRKHKSLYVVFWTEKEFKNSEVISQNSYKGFFRLQFAKPKDETKTYLVNPSGIYVDNIVIEKASEQNPES